ncbi:MAG: DUF92 domain-containing protein [Terriglobia bacterium]
MNDDGEQLTTDYGRLAETFSNMCETIIPAKPRSISQAWTTRRLFHLALIIPAFLLFSITWQETAGLAILILFFGVLLMPDVSADFAGGGEVAIGPPSRAGAFLYPLAILALALIFRQNLAVVAAAWALLALGDGMAGVVGESWGKHALPFNYAKTWEGFAAFIVFGGAGAFLLILWVSSTRPNLKALIVCLAAAVVGAFVESLPIRLNDNITVPLICGGFIFCAGLIKRASLDHNLPYLGIRVGLAIIINLAFALLAWKLRQITASGAAAGFLLGVAVYLGFGYKSFLILFCFFVLGIGSTRMGYARKRERGIAERRSGARSWPEAAANVLAAAFFAVLAITTPYQWTFLMAFIAAIAEAAGDTVASEIGKWLSPRAYLITTFRPVAAGENGGISLAGTAAGLGASGVVVLLSYGLGLCGGWNAGVVLGAACIGNLADSLIGATLERRGLVTNSIVNFMGATLAGGLALAFALR